MPKNARTFGQDLMRGEHIVEGGGRLSKANATPGGSSLPAAKMKDGHTQRGDGRGRPLRATNIPGGGTGKNSAWLFRQPSGQYEATGGHTSATTELMEMAGGESASHQSGTSIFDPVLCELVYRWFNIDGGAILDPFAGGSVRGIVAATLGYTYTGIDLSAVQIDANRIQAAEICPRAQPVWIIGDSRNIAELAPAEYDLVFSCPPYADLEVYSDDPLDLSTLGYEQFLTAYREIIAASVGMLKDDRFAVFVVGDVRDKKGFYRNFVSDTIAAFEDAGARLYNEAILVTACGSLPIRARKQFLSGRKLGKTHQNVLVFFKGDPRKIKDIFGEVEVNAEWLDTESESGDEPET